MNRYTYKNKITGAKFYLNEKSEDPDLELISEVRGGPINEDKVIKKNDRQGIYNTAKS
jgi:hypothetical protein